MSENTLTKMDIINIALISKSLVEQKGYDPNAIMTSEESKKLVQVFNANKDLSEIEDIILFEELNKLLVKAGVRFSDTPTLIS